MIRTYLYLGHTYSLLASSVFISLIGQIELLETAKAIEGLSMMGLSILIGLYFLWEKRQTEARLLTMHDREIELRDKLSIKESERHSEEIRFREQLAEKKDKQLSELLAQNTSLLKILVDLKLPNQPVKLND